VNQFASKRYAQQLSIRYVAGPRYPDGSDLKVIVKEGRRLPDGIVVDAGAGHLYWTNMGNPGANDGSIERANLDGKNIIHIVPPGGTFTPKQLQLDEKNRKLYRCDREGDAGHARERI
jgi:sugar lactone lactonase YvrE